jgi:hypothetical protein
MMLHPEIDALAPIQSSRHLKSAIHGPGEDGNEPIIKRTDLAADTFKVHTAHFGLTLIRTEALRKLPKPWFHSVPSAAGEWQRRRRPHRRGHPVLAEMGGETGNSLHIAPRVVIGHLELCVRWPDVNLEVLHQPVSEWEKSRVAAEGVWE